MRILMFCCLLLSCILPLTAGESAGGRLWLKDADNGDALVGPSLQQGIPAGHALKVALGGVRDKGRLAAGAVFTVLLLDGAKELARATITLNDTAYGEVNLPIAADLPPGVYQIRLDRGTQTTGLGGPFRVIEAAPPQNLPFGAGGAMLVLAALLAGLFLAWRRPRTA